MKVLNASLSSVDESMRAWRCVLQIVIVCLYFGPVTRLRQSFVEWRVGRVWRFLGSHDLSTLVNRKGDMHQTILQDRGSSRTRELLRADLLMAAGDVQIRAFKAKMKHMRKEKNMKEKRQKKDMTERREQDMTQK